MRRKKRIYLWFGILFVVSMLTGCKKTAAGEEGKEESREQESGSYIEKTGDVKDGGGTGEMISDEEAASLQYMEKVMVEDCYGNKGEYEMYAPIDSDDQDGSVSYYGHGLMFTAGVHTYEEVLPDDFKYEMWEEKIGWREEEWKEDADYSDVQVGEVMANGDDRYLIVSAYRKDYLGTSYEKKWVFYLDARGDLEAVEWELEISEPDIDEETEAIVTELAKCYGISLEGIAAGGEWAEKDAVKQAKRQDVYEPEAGDLELIKVDGYQHLGTSVLSFDDGEASCPVMVPMGWNTEAKGGRAWADIHGVYIQINGYKTYTMNYWALLEEHLAGDYRYVTEKKTGIKNAQKGKVEALEGIEQAAYCVLSYDEFDDVVSDYEHIAEIRALILIEDDYFLCCDITLRSNDYDVNTDLLLKELEHAYGMDLSAFYNEKEKSSEDDSLAKLSTMADFLDGRENVSRGSESLPETILWFNATYAALTYSNGCDWHLIGGWEPTDTNVAMTEMLLESSWGVKDRESAMETVESLLTKGHRGKCKEYMDQLEEWGLLSLKREEFAEKLMEHDIESDVDLGRYVVAYSMHLSGMEPEDMAAWDLCRVNQLYADFYICGYMSYEEAMDASLENSRILQEMYRSWEDMMDAYMIGYQFWQGDLAVDEGSPTHERYHYYEMLHDMEDGPYTLEWDMDLEKSW